MWSDDEGSTGWLKTAIYALAYAIVIGGAVWVSTALADDDFDLSGTPGASAGLHMQSVVCVDGGAFDARARGAGMTRLGHGTNPVSGTRLELWYGAERRAVLIERLDDGAACVLADAVEAVR